MDESGRERRLAELTAELEKEKNIKMGAEVMVNIFAAKV